MYGISERTGVTVIESYIDRALSAKTDNRPSFQRMIKDSNKHCFDMIIVWKLDRFARNRYDSAHYKSLLKKNGVKVVSAKETIAEGSEGILLESVLEGMAEYYFAELSEKVIRGLTENALKAKVNGGGIPFGYYIDENQKLAVDETLALIVKEVFTMYADGKMIKEIVAYLNGKGIKTRFGKPMSYNIIQYMLSNRKYIGEFRYRDIVIPDGAPAIISKDLFDKVQSVLQKNKHAPARHKAEDDFLLTTKLFCGKCGAFMVGDSGTGYKNKTYRYYKCITQKRKHACDKKTVNKDYIENLVLKAVMDKIMDDELTDSIADSLYELQNKENTVIPNIKLQIAETEKYIENIVNALQQGIIFDSTKKRLADLEEKKKELEDLLIQEQIKSPMLTKEQIPFGLTKFRNLDVSTMQGKQRLIDSFVNTIYLYDDYFIITCNYKDGSVKVSFDEINNSDLLSNGVPQ